MTQVSAQPLDRPLSAVGGITPARLKHLAALEIHTLRDLLGYFPRTYQHESAELPIAQLSSNGIQSARGEVVAVDYIARRPHPRFEATLDDGRDALALTWFNGSYLRRIIHPGQQLRVRGKVTFFRDMPRMANPKFEVITEETGVIAESKFRPIYPATAKLPSNIIEQIIADHLPAALGAIEEWFPPELLKKRGLIPRRQAWHDVHRPADMRQAMAARRRLVYDELMLMQLALGLSKRQREAHLSAPMLRADKLLDARIRRRFAFDMTQAQRRSTWEILHDLQSGKPMNRLLQGDVGSGKTAVAVYAMLVAVANRTQAALLAPTEILAEQHYLTLRKLLRDSSVRIELFTGRTRRGGGAALLRALGEGEIHIAVGTQALLQQGIDFANLGLVVVDEQHKLGVLQRATLKSKGMSPHYLVMTATPIPRTLALSYFADFAFSVIDELPPGRKPIKTRWFTANQSKEAYAFLRGQVEAGRQAYIVVPQIEDQGTAESRSVKKEFQRLSQGPLAGLRLAMLHGQMKTEEKQQTMADFRGHRLDAIVATTVIEVGIDVPNATVILIDEAGRFGLSQLHQLRGRVGRGGEVSYCLLLGDAPTESAAARLKAMTQTNDGFEIAEMDLKLRGPGEFFGTRQHGLPEFKLADLSSETDLLQQAREDALALLASDPRLADPARRPLREALVQQFGDTLPLAQIG